MRREKRTHKIYRNLFSTYTFVIIAIITILELLFITNIKNQVAESNINYNNLVCNEVGNYIRKLSDTADGIQSNLYQSKEVLSDVILYIENDIVSYYEKKLNQYSDMTSRSYHSIRDFSKTALDMNDSISSIAFVSYEQKKITQFMAEGDIIIQELDTDILGEFTSSISHKKDKLIYQNEIRDPVTLQDKGCMLIFFDLSALEKMDVRYQKSNLIIFYKDSDIIYNTKEAELQKIFEQDWNSIINLQQIEKDMKAYVSLYHVADINILSYIPKHVAEKIPFVVWISVVSVAITLFIIGEFLIHLRLDYLNKRLEKIITAMERVKAGKLDTYVELEQKQDEYDIIAKYFNDMCHDLDTYIQKSYLAEIEQKNAELSALQSQINPHFLYNTLESIRMKAISNGDREVGKMLYGLATIFRSQIKEKNIITIAKELHYCKNYLELFEFRYQGKFHFQVECKEEYLKFPIIKFVVQPIIENYFVHGIRLKEADNYLRIYANEVNDCMQIIVEDNGNGMKPNEIEWKNKELDELRMQSGVLRQTGSLGVANVHKRIVSVYGKQYGVSLEQNQPQGLRVIICFPKEDNHV